MSPGSNHPPTDDEAAGPSEIERDDAVIGRAFRQSLIVVVTVGLLVALGAVWMRFSRPKPVDQVRSEAAPVERREMPQVIMPKMAWTEITTSAGVDFRHENGATGEKLLPETMGGGVAFLDYDDDGDQDLLCVNSTHWPWSPATPDRSVPTPRLYANQGAGQFRDVTVEVGLNHSFYGQSVAIGDYDNDGDPDLFFSAVGKSCCFRNDAGKFVDVSDEVGLSGRDDEWTSCCGWIDFDNDGDLDLFVGRYLDWSRKVDREQNFQLTGGGRAYGRPQNFGGTFPSLFRNDQGKFTDIASTAGLHVKNPATGVPLAKSLGCSFYDFDGDGFLEIVVANDTVQNFLFRNQKDGTFQEIGALAGIAFDNDGNARGAMGIDIARFRNSEETGVAIGNFANEMSALYVTSGASLQFLDEAVATGFGPQTRLELTFGMLFADVDLDGRVDLLAANGHLEEDINRVQPSQFYEQPPHFFWNCGPGEATEFMPVPLDNCGPEFLRRMVGRGAAVADIDGDGDLDLVLGACGQGVRLLRNDQQAGHHWIRIRLEGTASNRDAIGAVVEAEVGDRKLSATMAPTRSYFSQSEKVITLGLGAATKVDHLTVRWPSGRRQTLAGVAVDQVLKLSEPTTE